MAAGSKGHAGGQTEAADLLRPGLWCFTMSLLPHLDWSCDQSWSQGQSTFQEKRINSTSLQGSGKVIIAKDVFWPCLETQPTRKSHPGKLIILSPVENREVLKTMRIITLLKKLVGFLWCISYWRKASPLNSTLLIGCAVRSKRFIVPLCCDGIDNTFKRKNKTSTVKSHWDSHIFHMCS